MYLGAYRFHGDPAELVPAYERLMANFGDGASDLHVCTIGPAGLVVLDACPSEAVFRAFSTGPEFLGACQRAGLPEPAVEHLGAVHRALLRHPVQS